MLNPLPLALLVLLAGDLDGDGCDDVVLEGRRVGDVRVFSRRSGEGMVRWETEGELRFLSQTADVALVPTAEDGGLEVLYVDGRVGRARVFTTWGQHVRSLARTVPDGGEPHRWLHAVTADGGVVVARRGFAVGYGTEHVTPAPIGRTWALDVADDLDGDGIRDLVVERPLQGDEQTRLDLVSGLDGSELLALEKRTTGTVQAWQSCVAAAGDVDGDDVTDVAVGAPLGGLAHPPLGTMADGGVVVHSGRDGEVLHELVPASSFDISTRFGARIVSLGDVDGDGHDDFAVSACKHDCEPHETQTGSVGVYSGRTGFRLFEVFGPPPGLLGYFGLRMHGPGDANGDGTQDLLVGSPIGWTLLSGRDGALLWMLEDGPDGLERVDEWTVIVLESRPAPAWRLCPAG